MTRGLMAEREQTMTTINRCAVGPRCPNAARSCAAWRVTAATCTLWWHVECCLMHSLVAC